MILKLAWRNIWRNRRRSFVTLSSVLFAVFFAVVLRALQLGTYDRLIDNVVSSYTGYIQIHQEGYWDDRTLEKVMAVDDLPERLGDIIPGVSDVFPRLESYALVATERKTRGGMIVGLDPVREDPMLDLTGKITAGELFGNDESSVAVAEGLARSLGVGPGDTLIILGQGYQGMSAAGKYPVCGIVKFPSPEMNSGLVLMSLAQAQDLFSAYGLVTSLVIRLPDSRRLEGIQAGLERELDPASYEIMSWRDLLPELVQTIQLDSGSGLIMILILYLVILFGIFGTLLMMLNERRFEFGVLISVGMSRTRLILVTLVEIVLLTLMGVVSGALLAAPLQAYLARHPIRFTGEGARAFEEMGWEAVMAASTDPAIAITHGVGVLLLTLVISLYAVARISRLEPVRAMRA